MRCILSALAVLALAVPALAQEPPSREAGGARIERHGTRVGERGRARLRLRLERLRSARLRHALREHRIEAGERGARGRERIRELARDRAERRRSQEPREPARGREAREEQGKRDQADRREERRGADPRERLKGERKGERGRRGRQRKAQK